MSDRNPLYADACDSGRHHARVVAAPLLSIRDEVGGVVAGYRCPRCGHTWTCSWGEVPGRRLTPLPPAASLFDRHLAAQVYELAAMNRAVRRLAS